MGSIPTSNPDAVPRHVLIVGLLLGLLLGWTTAVFFWVPR
jgi:hypothetical protein